MRGRFISFEGIDGAGKSSHVEHVARWLQAQGIQVVLTREPGGTDLAEAIRELVLARSMAPLTEALLVFAARHDHVRQKIMPALAQGHWVVCDRFTDSSLVYQGDGRGLPAEILAWLAEHVHGGLWPDRTYWFDLSPAQAAQRVHARAPADRFEAEQLGFFERVAGGYARIARESPVRVLRLDAAQTREHIAALIEADLRAMLTQATE
ncbi:MAG: dTMP kinase [Gammaproteobacteria bacterium]|nr:dTMP kinase [Gammaproteobacteria bacterium]